jgi:PKD repeat protein
MKKIITLVLLTLGLLSFREAKASHIAGGDLSYVCLGGDQYQINLNLFVDCLGFDPGASQSISFTSTCGGTAFATVNVTNPGGTEISQLCPSALVNSTCNGGTLPGMWVFHFTGTVTLTPACDTWTMSWTTCCRNAAILNLVTPASFGSYIEATLHSGTALCNNSPSFTAQPIPYVCQGQLVNYNYGIVEVDGDSLAFSLIGAMDAGATMLTYSGGYSATSPIPGIVIDPTTGLLTFTPMTLGNFVVVVLVEEYDAAGNLIGTVMRDIQFIVQSCSNVVPDPAPTAGVISGLTGAAVQTGPYSLELCEGVSFSFTATYTDSDAGDILTYITNLAAVMPGATITTSGTNPMTVTISWTAPVGTAGTNTTFDLTVNDGACPVPGQQTFVYDVSVLPRTSAGPDEIICGPQSVTLDGVGGSIFNWAVLSGPPMVVGTNFSCNPCANPVASPVSTTTYEVTSDLSGTCVNKDTVTITVVPDYSFTTTQSTPTLCMTQSVQFDVAPSPAGAGYSYQWSPSTYLDNDTLSNPTATLPLAGTFTYIVTITSPFGCVKTDTVSAIVQPYIRTNAFTDTILCASQTSPLTANGGTAFTWNAISGPALVTGTNISCNPCANPMVTPASTTTYVVTSDLTGTCINKDTVTVTVVPDFTLTTTQSETTTCLQQPIDLNTTASPAGTYSYQWVPSTYLTSSTIPNPTANILVPGGHVYYVYVSNAAGCVKVDTVTININPSYPPNPIAFASDTSVCTGETINLGVYFGSSVPAACGTSPVGCGGSLTSVVGTATGANTTTSYPAPYGNFWTSTRQQFLFRASELTAAGITGGKIDQLDWQVNAINGIASYHQFTIRMGCTNLAAIGTTWVTGLYQVMNPKTVNLVLGWNTNVFDNAFEWDGISNIVVEICSTEGPPYPNWDLNSITPFQTTSFASCLYTISDASDQCGTPDFPNQTFDRSITRFHYCGGSPDSSVYSYTWTPSAGLSSPGNQFTNATVNSNTNYTVIVTDTSSGCMDSASVNITATSPSISITANPASGFYPLDVTFTSTTSSDVTGVTWYFDDTLSGSANTSTFFNPTHTFGVEGTYNVVVVATDINGCTDTASITVEVYGQSVLIVPNVFTPGGSNPEFMITSFALTRYSIQIYNRWGKKVFESNDVTDSWDGNNVNDGTYFYIITAAGQDGKEYNLNGFVQRIGAK